MSHISLESTNSGQTVVQKFNVFVSSGMAPAVAAIQVLIQTIQQSSSKTIFGLNEELANVSKELNKRHPSSVSIPSGCDLFLRFVARTPPDFPDFTSLRDHLVDRGRRFIDQAKNCRPKIVEVAKKFVLPHSTVLIHGYSRVVLSILKACHSPYTPIKVICTETRPELSGLRSAQELVQENISVTVIADSAVGYVMEDVDLVLVGAEAVTASGGIVNKCGTFPISIVASTFNTPFYVACEVLKFARLFPLSQTDGPWATPVGMNPFPKFFIDSGESENDAYGNIKALRSSVQKSLSQEQISSLEKRHGSLHLHHSHHHHSTQSPSSYPSSLDLSIPPETSGSGSGSGSDAAPQKNNQRISDSVVLPTSSPSTTPVPTPGSTISVPLTIEQLTTPNSKNISIQSQPSNSESEASSNFDGPSSPREMSAELAKALGYNLLTTNITENIKAALSSDSNHSFNLDKETRLPVAIPEGCNFLNPTSDYTPAEYITLLFTDKGVMTPAVAGELVLTF